MITVLFGNNRYALRSRLNEIIETFEKQNGSSGVERYNTSQVEPGNLPNLMAGTSLFANKRLVVINDLSSHKQLVEDFEKLVSKVPEEIHVVLVESSLDKRTSFYKLLKANSELEEFGEMDEHEAVKWAISKAKNEGANLSSSDARLLVQYVGSDQLGLANEIEKLAAYDKNITKKSIELLVEKKPQETIFQLLELALGGNTEQAISVLSSLERAHEDPYQTASMLIWQTHILAVVSSSGVPNESQVAKDAKLNPFVVKKSKALAERLSRQQVDIILDRVAELDVTLKSVSRDPWRVLETTILSLQT